MIEAISAWAIGILMMVVWCQVFNPKIKLEGSFVWLALTVFPYGLGMFLFIIFRVKQ